MRVLVVSKSLCGFLSNQEQYNMESTQKYFPLIKYIYNIYLFIIIYILYIYNIYLFIIIIYIYIYIYIYICVYIYMCVCVCLCVCVSVCVCDLLATIL